MRRGICTEPWKMFPGTRERKQYRWYERCVRDAHLREDGHVMGIAMIAGRDWVVESSARVSSIDDSIGFQIIGPAHIDEAVATQNHQGPQWIDRTRGEGGHVRRVVRDQWMDEQGHLNGVAMIKGTLRKVRTIHALHEVHGAASSFRVAREY